MCKYDYNLEKSLNEYCIRKIIDYFVSSGIQIYIGASCTRTEIVTTLNVKEKFVPFVNYMLERLEAHKFIKFENENLTFLTDPLLLDTSNQLKEKIINEKPKKSELIDLLDNLTSHYYSALSGKIPAISILYPSANTKYIKPILSEMDEVSNINWFELFLKKFLYIKTKMPFKIMEVGGGDGRLTWEILPNLSRQNIKYFFTDISLFFTSRAKEKALRENLFFMEFFKFDINKSAELQNIEINSIDLLLAFNVIHASTDINITLTNLKKLLSNNGFLMIIEYTNLPFWLQMVWGLAEGWWHFSDKYRKTTPLISKEKWHEALLTSGYKNIKFISKEPSHCTPFSLIGIIAS